MKTLFIILLSVFIMLPAINFAQAPVTGIIYTYDASGNRIKREPAPQQQSRKAPPTEEKKENPSAPENNLQASFTPNPTGTGNFTVVVNNQYLSAKNANEKTDKPTIFVYNSLGELVEQESAQYNTQVNINLSAHPRGIYLVKVQSAEGVLMKRMVYE